MVGGRGGAALKFGPKCGKERVVRLQGQDCSGSRLAGTKELYDGLVLIDTSRLAAAASPPYH